MAVVAVQSSCLTLCNAMDCSTPGLPVPHHLPYHILWSIHYTPIGCYLRPSKTCLAQFTAQSKHSSLLKKKKMWSIYLLI